MFFVADVLVVGGGVIGMLSALELHARGASVAIYDAGPERAPASWAGGGILSPLFPWRYSDELNDLCVGVNESYQCWSEQIIAAGGIDPEVTLTGMLAICEDNSERVAAWSQVYQQEQSSLNMPLGSAYWLPHIGHVRNGRLLKGLKALLVARGVSIYRGVVDHLCEDSAGVTAYVGCEQVRADKVLVAAGWWSSSLLSGAFTSNEEQSETAQGWADRLFPAKGEMLLYRAPVGLLKHIILSDQGYLIPRRDGHILVGSTHEKDVSDARPSELAARSLAEMARRLLPEFDKLEPVAQWGGVRPGHSRDTPLIDCLAGSQRVWLSTGHYRNGLVAAPGSAKLVAQRISGETPDLDSSPYSFSSQGSSDSFCKR